ncbi:MAG: prepilin-type N-terminal cleavage/methylation domain-containing protein [Eubacterium sp.]
MQKKWKLNNKGMTLLEVIVAFAIFAVAATILFAGFNGAFKVIQNSNAIKDASQGSAGELEMKDYTIAPDEKKENVKSIIAKLPENKTLEITGGYFSATKNKSNDQTPITQTLFTAQTLVPKKIPEVPKDSKGVPVVPKKGKEPEDAYYSWDDNVKPSSFFKNDGSLETEPTDPFRKNNWPWKSYVDVYGEHHKGVVNSFSLIIGFYRQDVEVSANKHLEQLFFVYGKPFVMYSEFPNGKLTYHAKFVYLGDPNSDSNGMTMHVGYGKDGKVDSKGTTSLIFGSYDKKTNLKTILYLPKEFTIEYERPDGSIVQATVPAGFYELPDNTDILKVAYDDEFRKKFESYYRTYTKSQLEEMGITAVEQP